MVDLIQLESLLGINKKDANIYIDLLTFGSSAASTIAIRTQIDRTTTYSALKRMKQKGLISESEEKGTAVFSALSPNALEVKMEEEIAAKEKDLKVLQTLTPKLKQLENEHSLRPAVQIFQGASGIKALYEYMLKNNKKQDAFLTIEKLPDDLKDYLQKTYMQHKRRENVHSRVILNDSPRARRYQSRDKQSNRCTKLIPKGFMPFENEIIVGKECIAIIDLRGSYFGVLIKSESIQATLSALFNMLWGML